MAATRELLTLPFSRNSMITTAAATTNVMHPLMSVKNSVIGLRANSV